MVAFTNKGAQRIFTVAYVSKNYMNVHNRHKLDQGSVTPIFPNFSVVALGSCSREDRNICSNIAFFSRNKSIFKDG